MRNTDTPSSTPRGFTLVELLVVITIILILLGLLFPVLGAARRSARTTTTEALVRDVLTACDSFKIDQGRPPGYFSVQEMGQMTNMDERGFTAMENAIVELMGTPIKSDAWNSNNEPDPDNPSNSFLEIGPHVAESTRNIRIDLAAIGSSSGPGYLTLKSDNLYAVSGQFGDLLDENGTGEVKWMFDIVDSFGQPLMMWIRDPAGPVIVDNYEKFAKMAVAGERAHYYWASNAGYLQTDRLGEDESDHGRMSTLGQFPGANPVLNGDMRIEKSMTGLLGSPAFPRNRTSESEPWFPAKPRGDIVVVSAGADRIFFKKKGDTAPHNYIGYAPSGQTPLIEMDSTAPKVEEFDDIVQSTGG